ncbi:Ig-like domain-containing protein [Haloarcula amylolytica]|uniref:Ig-like domain-containing protein n=1 Tax=Haloarcula amylolytica TaxID=396317 RepID=UPI003C762949
MTFTGDERAQSVQVGAVLLFGVLIIAFSSYQAFAVPEQNREVEFNHNQQVQTQLQDLRNAIVSVPGQPSQQAVSVQLGTRYPSRLVATNPGPPSGLLYTDGTTNESQNLTVRNAEAINPETADYWNGTASRHYNTGAIAYKPEYNVYGGAPETVYEHSLVYNQFREGNITLSKQAMVDGRDITLVALNGSLSRSASDSVTVDVRPKSQSSRTVRVRNATETSNVSVSFLSRLPASKWNETLDEELDPNPGNMSNDRYVADVTGVEGPGSLNRVTIVFERGATYRLKMAKAGVGTRVTEEREAYLTTVDGDAITVARGTSEEIVLEVRDAYNNPESGVTVNGSASAGSLTTGTESSDSDGRVTFEYQADSNTPVATNQVNFSLQQLDSSFRGETPENVSVSVKVTAGSGSGGNSGNNERIGLAYNNDALALDNDDPDTIPGGIQYSFTNTHDQQVEITDISLTSQSTNVDRLSDQVTPNNQRERTELYIDGDIRDGYTDIDGGTDLPADIDIDTDGFANNGNPEVSGQSDGVVYLYEFRPDGSNDAVDMSGKSVTQTITYTFPNGETRATAFTVTGDNSESDPDIRPPIADFGTVKHNTNAGSNNDDVQFTFRVADKSGIDSVELTATDEDGTELNSATRNPSSGSLVDYSLDLGSKNVLSGNNKEVNVAITLVDNSGNTHICEGTIRNDDTDLIDARGLRCRTP